MGIFSKFMGGVVSEGISTTLTSIGDTSIKIRSAITGEPSPEKTAELEQYLLEIDNGVIQAQNKLNELESKSSNFLIAGWRPSLGWVCTISVALYYIPRFILGMSMWFLASYKTGTLQPMPEMGIQEVLGLVASMLGLGSLRTIEKIKDVHKEH